MTKEMIKPYGDTLNDGMVQLAFTLPVACGPRAKKAAELYVAKLNFTDIAVSFAQEIADNFTYFVVYAKALPELDYSTVQATEAKVQKLGFYRINELIKTHINRKLVVVGASIGSDTQDLKYKGARTKVVIGDKTVIREFATVTLSTLEGQVTKIGSNCLLMAYSHVAHECEVGDNVILANSATLAGHAIIEDFAIIGGLTPVHQFSRVGCHSIVGGASAVQKDVLPYTKAFGNPLKMYGLNTLGLDRRGFTQAQRDLMDQAYRIIFRSGLNTTQALLRLKEEMEMTPEIKHMVEFIEGSERGITK